jgi:hypothetical protein
MGLGVFKIHDSKSKYTWCMCTSELARTLMAFEVAVTNVTETVLKEQHNSAAPWTAQCFISVYTSY